ncbi:MULTISPECIES: hypothetical protein [unclassified Pseudomonas]|nr:hypothetical protein [Pseudomonas sp. QS1027]
MVREEEGSGHWQCLGFHLLGLGIGAGLILGLTLLACLLTVNFY